MHGPTGQSPVPAGQEINCIGLIATFRMNPNIRQLQRYPFERLRALLAGHVPPADRPLIPMSIGEPRHAPPGFVIEALHQHAGDLGSYPPSTGLPELRQAMAAALARRYPGAAKIDPQNQILPVGGTREGLFAFVQAMLDPTTPSLVAMPNPFYQIYEGATILAGATPYYINTPRENAFLPDLDAVPDATWAHCQLLVLCSPGNPTGAVIPIELWQRAFELADRFNFVIAADECYADIYTDESAPPPGALEAARLAGRERLDRLVVFHSLSKRSSIPGLRSGFAAGDRDLIGPFAAYRTYHGVALPLATQYASLAAWNEPTHVAANRRRYQAKFHLAEEILGPHVDLEIPAGAFYLWLAVPGGDDERFARDLYIREGLITLPGRYLSRPTANGDPGAGYLRISLVPDEDPCRDALLRLSRFIRSRVA